MFWRCNRSKAALSEQEHQLREREVEQAEALAALEVSRKTLEGAAAFVQVRRHEWTRKEIPEHFLRKMWKACIIVGGGRGVLVSCIAVVV